MSYNQLRIGRQSVLDHAYVITTVTADRRPLFSDLLAARKLVREMQQLCEQGLVESLAYVVMPDHLHWLLVLRQGSLARLVQQLKGKSAYRLGQGPVWQPGFYDHGLRHEAEIKAQARYLIANPLRAGLVQRIGDYPHWDAIWL